MEQIVELLKGMGIVGLAIVSFAESIFSPVLPDFLLIPMALAAPEKAIYYAAVATAASVIGGLIGYLVGNRYGIPVVRRFVPTQYTGIIRDWLERYGVWAVVVAAMAPIPFKFVAISAGVFRINPVVFFLASIVGRAKRFMLEGLLIFYYGPLALDLIKRYGNASLIFGLGLILAWLAIKKLRHSGKETIIEEWTD